MKAVIEIAERIDVTVKPGDISVAHRVVKQINGGPRQVLCRFISPQTKDKMLHNRK